MTDEQAEKPPITGTRLSSLSLLTAYYDNDFKEETIIHKRDVQKFIAATVARHNSGLYEQFKLPKVVRITEGPLSLARASMLVDKHPQYDGVRQAAAWGGNKTVYAAPKPEQLH
jgi:hypothetical protein